VKDFPNVTFTLHGQTLHGLVPSYGHAKPGDLVALEDSEGYIEIAQVNGNARKALAAQIDDIVEVRLNG
jgi:S-adenosylmethionine hydrolase